ncbi:hypothetical protein Vi05172_g11148 [Venturia inaequalis]|nr:hypothetical protein Vi05172_g11148 [Venturia inaequalis]
MTKQPSSFLSLPHELRQKIILNTYDDGTDTKQIGEYKFSMCGLVHMVHKELFSGDLRRGRYTTVFLPRLVKAVDAWSVVLKDVHPKCEADVGYVVQNLGNVKWIKFVRSFAAY